MNDQISEIKSKTDIVAIIGERVELKKAGSNFKGLCPFHSEKTPSFMVSPELQIFKCFGCGKSGDVIAFLEEFEGMEFSEVIKFLADKAGIKLKSFEGNKKGLNERLVEVNSEVSKFYQYILHKHPSGKIALDYLTTIRGLTMETIRNFKLGYSPDVVFALKQFAIDRKKITKSELEQAGIIWVRDGRAGDRFRGRVIFPLDDHRGNTVGFAGRVIPSQAKPDSAKYINSPETPVYHKSRILYGLNETRQSIKKEKEAIIVEGELDLISCWQAGIKNVVAIKGSALTEEQVKLLSRFTKKLVFALDTDFAGNEAARRGIFIAEREGMEVTVATIGKFKDPDEAARADPELLKKYFKNASGIWDFIIDSVIKKHKGETGEEKSKISKELIPLLAQIEDKIVQAHYINLLSRRLQVPMEAVSEQVANAGKSKTGLTERVPLNLPRQQKNRREMLEERYLSIMLRTVPERLGNEDAPEIIKTTFTGRIVKAYLDFPGKKKFNLKEFADFLPPELKPGFSDLLLKDVEGLQDADKDALKNELAVVERELKVLSIREKLEEIAKRMASAENINSDENLSEEEKDFTLLTKKLLELEAKN